MASSLGIIFVGYITQQTFQLLGKRRAQVFKNNFQTRNFGGPHPNLPVETVFSCFKSLTEVSAFKFDHYFMRQLHQSLVDKNIAPPPPPEPSVFRIQLCMCVGQLTEGGGDYMGWVCICACVRLDTQLHSLLRVQNSLK
jgi:hypothetical protein